MIVKFVTECEITICENTEDEEGSTEVFHVGQTADFEIFGHPERLVNGEWVEDEDYVNVQFADGSVAFGIGRDWYEVIQS